MKISKNASLAPFSTLKIGGPAEYLATAANRRELLAATNWAQERRLKLTVLGNGSNTLIPDEGLKGLVVRNMADEIEVLDIDKPCLPPEIIPRFQLVKPDRQLKALVYDETKYPPVLVRLASGAYLPKAIFQLIGQGITGLEWFAGIPATAGGASFINLHGADKYWSDYLVEAELADRTGRTRTVAADYFDYDYDRSVLKTSGEVVLSVTLKLRRGPAEQALKIAKFWQQKKAHQPQRSLGCIFQNLTAAEQKRLGLPTPSIGYLVDKKLKLKGKQIGRARIAVKHAGFVENLGGATAAEVKALISLVRQEAKKQLGLDLKLEIVVL